MARVRVLLVDDDPLVRAGLRLILSSAEDIEIVGESDDGIGADPSTRCQRTACRSISRKSGLTARASAAAASSGNGNCGTVPRSSVSGLGPCWPSRQATVVTAPGANAASRMAADTRL